jgi:hypothetical protein
MAAVQKAYVVNPEVFAGSDALEQYLGACSENMPRLSSLLNGDAIAKGL